MTLAQVPTLQKLGDATYQHRLYHNEIHTMLGGGSAGTGLIFASGSGVDGNATVGSGTNDIYVHAADYALFFGGFRTVIGGNPSGGSSGAINLAAPIFSEGASQPLFTVASSDRIPIRVQGTTAQSVDLQQWHSVSAMLAAIDKDGRLVFGPSGAQDTNLFRSAANVLKTDDDFHTAGTAGLTVMNGFGQATKASAGDTQVVIGLYRDAGPGSTPGLLFGVGGSTAPDVNLYRNAANILKTDDKFEIGGDGTGLDGDLTVYGATAGSRLTYNIAANEGANNVGIRNGKIVFGAPYDTNLYRSAADILKTDDDFKARDITAERTSTSGVVYFGDPANLIYIYFNSGNFNLNPASAKLLFGDAGDTNLYRSAPNELKTDDAFRITRAVIDPLVVLYGTTGAPVQISLGRTAADMVLGVAGASNNYVAGAATGDITIRNENANDLHLATNGGAARQFTLKNSGQVQLPIQGSTGGLLIGGDASLYRGAADVLELASGDAFRPASSGQDLGDSTHQWQVYTQVIATGSLPAAAASMDGTVLIEDAGAGDRNLIIYAGGQRFRIDGGANV